MKILQIEQGSPEWLMARAGIVTASELDTLVSLSKMEMKRGDGVETYLARKLAERWCGAPMQSFSGGVMEQGSILETEARPFLELTLNADIEQVGFITTDAGDIGCSPDGVIGLALIGQEGVEIKAPQPPNHVKWLLAGGLPKDHVLQVQGGMYVTGFATWKFCSYCRGFPPLILTVRRDEEVIDLIDQACESFNRKLKAGWESLLAINGGPPVRTFNTTIEDGVVTRTLAGAEL